MDRGAGVPAPRVKASDILSITEMMLMIKKTVVENSRSAVSGRFVTEHYAKTHPKTTVTERNPPPKPPSRKGK